MNLMKRNERPLVRRNDLFNFMDDFFEGFPGMPESFKSLDRDFSPTIELKETKDHYLVEVDIPGMKKEDIKLHFENNCLYIRGEKKTEKEESKDDEKVHYSERFYGSFTRKIPFSEDVEANKIDAKYSDGVLNIKLHKKPSSKNSSQAITIH